MCRVKPEKSFYWMEITQKYFFFATLPNMKFVLLVEIIISPDILKLHVGCSYMLRKIVSQNSAIKIDF